MTVINLTPTNTIGSTFLFNTQLNTNNNIKVVNNSLQIVNPGIYKISGCATLESSAAGESGMNITVNGTEYGMNFIVTSAAVDEVNTIPICTVMQVNNATNNSYVTIAFTPIAVSAVVNGNIVIEKIS